MSLYCDGIARRDFLRIGLAGGAGLSLANYLRLADAGEARVIRAERVVVGDRSWRTDENRLTRSHIDAECIGAAPRRARRQ